jgi:intein/homing endonuclease
MNYKITKNEEDYILKSYINDKKSANQIGKELGYDGSTITKFLKRKKIECRPNGFHNRKYSFNYSYFNKIDSIDKAYWLGFLYADGYNAIFKNCVVLGLAECDIGHLEKFKNEIDFTGPFALQKAKKKNQSNIIVLNLCSQIFCKDLEKLGCMQNKTFKLVFPQLEIVSDKFIKHFIRGYFDGDGCLTWCDYKGNIGANISFCGTFNMIMGIKNFLKNELEINSSINKRHKDNKNNYTLMISGTRKTIFIMDWMYKDKGTFLQRKYEKFLKLLHHYKIHVKYPSRFSNSKINIQPIIKKYATV